MRNYAISIYITTPLTIVALSAAMLLHYCATGANADFWCNVCLGIFGSGLLTVLVSCVGYASEKKKTMEGFFYNTLDILRFLSRYDGNWERDRKIDFFICYGDMNLDSWDMCYGDMLFLFDFSKKKMKYVFEKIYSPIISFNKIVGNRCYHLRLYKNGDSNNTAVIDKMLAEIESLLITEEKSVVESEGRQITVTHEKSQLTNPVLKELYDGYYNLMYRKSQREGA